MRLVLEVPDSDYEAVQGLDMLVLTVPVVEVRQEGGLLSHEREVALVEGIGGACLEDHGLETGPAMRVFLMPRGNDG